MGAQLEPFDLAKADPLDRAWRAVDALGGRWPVVAPNSEAAGYQAGYDAALDAACEAIKKLGGMDPEVRAYLARQSVAAA